MPTLNSYPTPYVNPMPNNQVVAAYVDRYELFQQYKKNHYKQDPKQEARLLKMLFNVFAPEKRLLAIVDQDDKEGIEAYGAEGYDLRTMNGDRPHELLHVVNRETTYQRESRPQHVVVVSDDQAFVQLCAAAQQNQAEVSVWLPGFQRSGLLGQFATRQLTEMVPDIHIQEAASGIWLDIENLLFSLKQARVQLTVDNFVHAIRNTTKDIGNITHMIAYGDFEMLAKEFGHGLQSQLVDLGIEPRFQKNMRGKNSADMKIASDIHNFLERDSYLQTVIIGSGDRDFRPTIDTARSRGKKVILLAVEGSLSDDLKRAADEVRYLNRYFNESNTSPSSLVDPHDPWIDLLMGFTYHLYQKRARWGHRKELTTLATPERLQQAVEAGVLKLSRPGDPNGLMLHPDNHLAQAVSFFVPWLVRHVEQLVETKVNTNKLKYIDRNFLFKGMSTHPKCQTFGIGADRANANSWLDAAAKAKIVRKKPMPHFSDPTRGKVDTWWPIGVSEEKAVDKEQPAPRVPVTEAGGSDAIHSTQSPASPTTQPSEQPQSGPVEVNAKTSEKSSSYV